MNKLKILLIVNSLFLNFFSFSQDSTQFILHSSIETHNSIWDVDELGNTIVAEANEIKKYDLKGNLLFTQSIKSVGKITKLDARNPMKILFFSENVKNLLLSVCVCKLREVCFISAKNQEIRKAGNQEDSESGNQEIRKQEIIKSGIQGIRK